MKNILVTGGYGQLGQELSKILPSALYTSSEDLDITDVHSLYDFVNNNNVETIINCAAYTAVDNAESDRSYAMQINSVGVKNLASVGKKLIHISTDYVFDGQSGVPYREIDKANPLSVYGVTKLCGEQYVLQSKTPGIVIRTSWLYSNNGKNFFKTMQRLGKEKESVNVVADQYGTPTYAHDLADVIVNIVPQMNAANSGLYHFSNMGECSWYDFACEIMKLSNLKCNVKPITTQEYPTRAIRPQYSVLDKSRIQRIFGIKIDTWQNALQRCINEKTKG